jgi:type II restriction/modification system DNA methylase subunit YeeA
LVDELLNSALDPVLDRACKNRDPELALLDLKICDRACGSGHFLIAAAKRTAKRLATVRTSEVEPSPEEVQAALRDVIAQCIYGVDSNPTTVELCKFSLWLESMDCGRPLSFLENRIKCGNSLLGATPAAIAAAIPDEAFTVLTGCAADHCGYV